MPSLLHGYEVNLVVTNNTQDCATLQLLRDYGRNTGGIVLLHPTESVTLVLDSGSSYRYAVKTRMKVANITARSWRDIRCDVSRLFESGTRLSTLSGQPATQEGVSVDRIWRDNQIFGWNEQYRLTSE